VPEEIALAHNLEFVAVTADTVAAPYCYYQLDDAPSPAGTTQRENTHHS